MRPERPIDRKQIQLIHIAKAQLGLSDEEYRKLLLERYDSCFQGSSKELTYKEAGDLINHFKGMGFTIKRKPRPKRPPGITALASPQQMAKIDHLRADIRWRFPDGYDRVVKKILKKDRVVTGRDAGKVIECLKGIKAGQQTEASGKGAVGYHRDGQLRGRGRVSW